MSSLSRVLWIDLKYCQTHTQSRELCHRPVAPGGVMDGETGRIWLGGGFSTFKADRFPRGMPEPSVLEQLFNHELRQVEATRQNAFIHVFGLFIPFFLEFFRLMLFGA